MTNKEYLKAIQDFLIDVNLDRTHEEVLNSIDPNDEFYENHLKKIKLLRIQQKSKIKQSLQKTMLSKLEKLIEKFGSVDNLITQLKIEPQYERLVPFFRKLENVSDNDLTELLLESKLMEIINETDFDEIE